MADNLLKLAERQEMDKQKALDSALAQIERSFGKGSIMKLGQREAAMDVEAVSTGSLGSGYRAGNRRVAEGPHHVEIYGPESSGKTTLALHTVAEEQKKGGTCAFVDAEHALDPAYARKLGVDVDELLISQPDAGEQALEITDTLVRSGAVSVIVVDSVAALTPRVRTRRRHGRQPRLGSMRDLMSQAMRKLTGSISRSKCMVIFINQIRMKIGVMFGSPETTTGGNALKFYASVRLDIRRIGAIKDRDEVVGNATRVKVVKNKVAPPFKPGRVRHHVWRRHLEDGGIDRPGRQSRCGREVGFVVFLWRRTDRPGSRKRQAVPARQPSGSAVNRGQDPRGNMVWISSSHRVWKKTKSWKPD